MPSFELLGFTGVKRVMPSQKVFLPDVSNDYIDWVVPPGVYSISTVVVQRGTNAGETWTSVPSARIVRNGTDLVRALNGNSLRQGGGDGGWTGGRLAILTV